MVKEVDFFWQITSDLRLSKEAGPAEVGSRGNRFFLRFFKTSGRGRVSRAGVGVEIGYRTCCWVFQVAWFVV